MQPGVLLLLMSYMGVPLLAHKLEWNHEKAIVSLNSLLLRSTRTFPANPSVHIALRLSEKHNLHEERSYLRRLKADLRRFLSRAEQGSRPFTGLVALHLLALRASCQDLQEKREALLYLKNKLSAERNQTIHHQVPLTNYYQYSLGVLALCVNHIRIDHSVLSGLMPHDHHHHHHHSADTSAVVVLALKCVQESTAPGSDRWMYSTERRLKVQQTINKLMEKIRRRWASNGEVGNIYSTPLALQALLATGDTERWLKGKINLLNQSKQGAFQNPMALSQLLPVLYRKTYLDIGQMDCRSESDDLRRVALEPPEPGTSSQSEFVYINVKGKNLVTTYTARVPLLSQMSLLQVLQSARRNDTNFNFETEQTLWGPFLTSVNHVPGQDDKRTYWRLISGARTPLIQGIQDYYPQPGEHILLQLSNF
ncbi:transcobalamin-2-like [Rhinoraja longicauda]